VIDDDKATVWEQHVAYADPKTQGPSDWRSALYIILGGIPRNIASQLNGLAIDATSGTVLLCDSHLMPVSDALLYNDVRAQHQSEQLKGVAPLGHVVCSANSGLSKFLWLTQQEGAEAATYFLHQADWLAALLSGQGGVSDYHNALKTGYDVERLRWPEWLMALPHFNLLPQVLAPGEPICRMQPDIAARFGINMECVVHAGTTDSTAAFIASGVTETGVGVTSLGTTLVLKLLSKRRIEAPENGVYSHRYGGLWLVGGASNAGAGVLRQYFDDAQLAALSALIDPQRDTPLDYYPLPEIGERFPVNDPTLVPKLLPRPDNDADFLHGLLQGLSRIEAAGYAKLAELGATPVCRVVTNGGGSKNAQWGGIRERLLGVPVSRAAHAEAAYGSALLCTGDYFSTRNNASNSAIGEGLLNR